MTRAAAARAIVHCCRSLWEAGLIAGADGNVSVRYRPTRLLITPRGRLKADLTPRDLVSVDLRGRRLGGFRQPSTELDLHLRVYRRHPDCGAVVHAHPPAATAFAATGRSIRADILPEVALLLGRVPLVPYATPGTLALGDLVEPHLRGHVALLLANHGAVTWGPDLTMARIRMESLEHAARILVAARAIGRVRRLSPRQLRALARMRGRPSDG